ncbi:dihydroorotate oxidase B, electron transfer subunit [Candidatus Ruthia magnifica str. Cm (Calyptogena magnifica)]|uniref:Dihydroorotate oxidase B, electron transfer subunit n=1 Tax=Ruthia magnifica subsp. Calyptogena magnifica TaxID=413404 RepID=A1AVQ8_RUTMC|nr:dihydroorotate dehydrogenase electron transfer subunit [Candidatus Ruthturnera calyptogenae]ABL02015.1 dihydroorotate oxidase B, electron transfer subunit [Candidatus Ruthia magnifica str. Cm (Calyptogena magnifica)]
MNKASIKIHDCQILAHYQFEGKQYILTLASNIIAKQTKPGQFVHLTVSSALAMRRPISIMSVDIENGTFDLLYKVVGEGTRQLSQRKVGDILSIIGPIGNGFKLTDKKRPLLIGGGAGMPPMIAIAQQIKDLGYESFAILGSEVPFPFVDKLADNNKDYQGATYTMPELEDWGIECRLTSLQGFDGTFKGFVTDLAKIYLDNLKTDERMQVEIYACGPRLMLVAVANLAKEYNLPCQISLEENMACAVGGCAGCVVEIQTNQGISMKRVCVDGPVFDAYQIF